MTASLGGGEVAGHLSADPAGRHIRDFRGRHHRVHVLVEIDAGTVAVDGDTLFELYRLAEDVVG